MSDLHIEFYQRSYPKNPEKWFRPQKLSTDSETVLGLAGDIFTKRETLTYIKSIADQFFAVVFIYGNHDYWHRDINNHIQETKELVKSNSNIHFLENDFADFGNVVFVGATCWTDMDNDNPILNIDARMYMNDFKYIRKDNFSRRFIPNDTIIKHLQSKKFIFDFAANNPDKNIIVLSHHAPSFKSIDQDYVGSELNGAYASELGNQIAYAENIKIWQHGHIHANSEYEIFNTKVVCNPRGYFPSGLNKGFNENLLYSLETFEKVK
jgi:predicted phosphohydrolase